MRLIDAPVGLFLSKEGELCMKTEHIADWGFEAYIVRSGETYWGGAKTAKERNNLDVTPVDAVPVVRCKKCVLHGNCVTEDAFVLAGIENPFCCAGKREEGAN